jgi:hypothetical protein
MHGGEFLSLQPQLGADIRSTDYSAVVSHKKDAAASTDLLSVQCGKEARSVHQSADRADELPRIRLKAIVALIDCVPIGVKRNQ